jgi:aqualysin 1
MRRSLSAGVALCAILAACSDQGSEPQVARRDAPAPVFSAQGAAVEGSYIVVLKEGADARSVAAVAGVNPHFVYGAVLNGFAGTLNAGQLNALTRNPNVDYIEQDGIASINTIQTGATWGLDRVDQRALPLSTTYNYLNTGLGVTAYIIDTGANFSLADFAGRITSGYDAVDGGAATDCNGHGTHVAGTVGGTKWGVAKAVNLVAVRVLDCAGSGSWSGIIAGMDWVAANHQSPAVANMSLGGGLSTAVNDATNRLIASGVTTAVAAGNGNRGGKAQDACGYSPASTAAAITVGATDITDTKASFSNYGTCVDFFAPGVNIKSDWYNTAYGADNTRTISGTSMASPHVAGVAALYLQSNPGATPQQVRDALFANTTKGVVKNSNTVNNHLLYSNY